MSMRSVHFLILGITLLVAAGPASAALSKNEQILQREAARLDRTASTPTGEKAVAARLARDFRITAGQLEALREKGLSYSEITVALTCARSLPGGANEENLGRVLALRQGPPPLEWAAVARKLGVKLGKCVSQVKKVNNESRREMKKSAASDRGEATQAPGAPTSLQPRHHEFTGEGKPMTRGSDAQ